MPCVKAHFSLVQKRVLRLWLVSQRRCGSSQADDTEARLQELCAAEGWSVDRSDGEEDEEEEMDNSEPLDDSDVVFSDSGRVHRPLLDTLAPHSSGQMNIEVVLCCLS